MTFSFHLTDKCNLNCKYCFEGEKKVNELTFEDIKQVIDREFHKEKSDIYIDFFGGEPLLKKQLIYDVVNYTNKIATENNVKTSYATTTNGTLIDNEFTMFAKKNNFFIGISIDGNEFIHNRNRVFYNEQGTYNIVIENSKKILKYLPYSYGLMVVTKNNYERMYESVKHLFDEGFKNILLSLDYMYDWKDEDLEIIKYNFERVAKLYYEKTKNKDRFIFLPFDTKINMHINKKSCLEHRELGSKNVNVGADKNIYPCVQFVGKEEYIIGNCKDGIDKKKIFEIIKKIHFDENTPCKDCTYRHRCNSGCCCSNMLSTGKPDGLSPFVCETERMIIEISDNLAERLYKEQDSCFMEKMYYDIDFDRLK